MNTASWISLDKLSLHPLARIGLPVLAISSLAVSLYMVFCVVAGEAQMGAVQRIFYFHVGSAITSYCMIAVLLLGSAFFLVTEDGKWDLLSQSAAAVAFLFCSLVLLTGMIWGHSAWNAWWRWEPRLVTSLVLWLILASYLTVRNFSAGHSKQRNFLAVLGIISACFVPIVVFSVRMMNQTEQLHPQVIGRQGLTDPSYRITLLLSTLSLIVCAAWFLLTALANRLIEAKTDDCERKLQQILWEREHGHA